MDHNIQQRYLQHSNNKIDTRGWALGIGTALISCASASLSRFCGHYNNKQKKHRQHQPYKPEVLVGLVGSEMRHSQVLPLLFFFFFFFTLFFLILFSFFFSFSPSSPIACSAIFAYFILFPVHHPPPHYSLVALYE
ncbi:MAG: hypothetical protein JOS17DRAFT_144580 [Linnemannia elongata]|nr:MAG: hypothetical protein JOS17DRAFT_144580 [Linnemannia elongata]